MAEKDFRVKKGLAVEGTGNSTITGKLAIGSEETGGPSTSHSNILRVSGDTTTDGIAKTSVSQLLVKTQNNGQDALVTIRGRRNGSTSSNQAVLQFGNHDDNATGGGSQVEFSALGAIAGRVSDSTNNVGDMVFVTYADGATASDRMTIKGAGNVGIGTTSPDYKLHVVGSGYFTDDLRVGAETPGKITLNGNDAYVEGQLSAEGTGGSYLYSLALGGETPTSTSGEILGAKATLSGSSAGDYEALKLVNTNDTDNAAVTALHMSNKRGVDSAFFLEHDAFGNTKMFTGQGGSVATSAGSDMNLGITILESGAVRLSDAFTFPTALGNAGQVLKVPSSGSVLEWANDDSAAGGASALNQLTDVLISNDSLFINNFGSAPVTGTLSTASDNLAIGDAALNDITSGDQNLALGYQALTGITTGSNNIGLGPSTGAQTTAGINNSVFIGNGAGFRMDGDDNIAVGRDALKGSSTNTNNTGTYNVGIGYLALFDITSADRNVAIGHAPLQNVTTGGFNVAIGNNTLGSITTGIGNVAIGSGTADLLTDGENNVAIGAAMGDVDTGIDYNVALGYRAGRYLGSDDNVAIGKDALVGSSTATNNTGVRNVAIGKNAMDEITSGSDNVAIGFHAAGSFTSSANSVAVGREALSTITSGTANTAVGYQAGKNLTGTGNVAFGPQALLGLSSGTIDGQYNLAMGYQPMWEIQGGDYNVALGFEAMQNIRSGGSNIAIGRETMKEVDDDAIHNIALGYQAGYYVGENYGIAIGYQALKGSSTAVNNTGLRNTAIGYTALESFTTGDDNIAIGNNALGDITTGDDNIAIGQSAGAQAAAGSIGQIFLGRNSGFYMGGNSNVGIGDNNVRGSSTVGNNTGTFNVGVGHFNLSVITTGSDNIGLGQLALKDVSTGNQNIGIGHDAGTAITTGSGNILIGKDSGDSIVDGSFNVLIGEDAGQNITSGDDNLILHAGDNSADAPSSATADRQLRISSGSHVWFYGYDGNLYLGRNHLQRFPASGTDISGSDLEIGGSAGTGTGEGGDIKLQYSPPAGSTGSANNAHVDAITISGATGDVTIHKNLTVSGTTTTLNTENMTVEDKNIVLGSGNATAEVVDGTGLTLEGGSGDDITFQYNTTDDRMELKHGTAFEDFKAGTVTGTFVGGLTGNVTGNVSGTAATVTGAAQTNITSLGTLTSLAISGDLTVDTSTLKVDSTNNRVGIGVTSPSSKLDVDGTIECTGLNLQDGTLDYGGGKQQSANLAVGWYTFAVVKGRDALGNVSAQRAFGEFLINDVASSRHGSCRLNATHMFGAGNSIQVFAYNFFSTVVFTELRIKESGTYSGAALQVYVSNASNNLESYMTMTEQSQSWVLLDTWIADTDTSGHDALVGFDNTGAGGSDDSFADFLAAETLDLSVFFATNQGGIYTTGGLKSEQIRNGKAGTNSFIYLSPDTDNSFILASSSGTDVTLAADDDLVLHADDAIIFQTEGTTKFGMHNGRMGIGAGVATTAANLLHITGDMSDNDQGILITRNDTSTSNNDLLGGIGFDSNDGNIPSSILEASAAIVAKARLDHSTTNKGGYMEFMYSPTASADDTTSTVGMTFIDGKLAVNNFGLHPLTSFTVYHQASDFNDGMTIINRNTTIASGDLLGAIGFDSKDGSAPSQATEASAGIAAFASQDHSATEKGGHLTFFTAPDDQDDDTASLERMRITSAGNVGIGTTIPSTTLDVAGTVEATQFRFNANLRIGNPATNEMAMFTAGTERMRFDASGNVGIGTTAPDQKLHVEGSILADAYNFATTTLASNYTASATSLVLTDSSQFPAKGSGTIDGDEFVWSANNTSTNTLTITALSDSYTSGVTVVADTGLFFRDGFENVAQPSVTIYDRANSGDSRDDLSINANSGIRFRLGNESQMQLTADQLSLTTGNQGAAAIFGFRDRADMGIKSNTSFSVGVLAPDNVYINIDSNNNNVDNTAFIVAKNSNVIGSGTELFRVAEDGNVGIGTASPTANLDVHGTILANPTGTYAATVGGGSDTSTTAAMVFDGNADIFREADGYLRRVIGASSSTITIGQDSTSIWNTIDLIPGHSGKIRLYSDNPSTNSAALTMTIDDAKVGIGTTSPNQKLTVEGSMSLKEQASANADTTAYGQLWVKSDSPNNLYFTNDAGTDIQITTSSGVNASGGGSATTINNNADDRIITGSGTANTLNAESALTWDGGTLNITSEDTVSEAIKVTITDTDSTADSTPFVVDGNGRVGIGTASPLTDCAITLNGDGTTYEGIAFQVGGSTKWKMNTDGAAFYLDSRANTLDYNLRLRDSSGNFNTMNINADTAGTIKMGLGVAPVALLHVKADSSATSQSSAGSANITIEQDGTGDAALNFLLTSVRRWTMGIDNSDSDKFKIQTGSTSLDGTNHVPAMTITAAGNVGLGTTSPQSSLHVSSGDSGDAVLILEADTDNNDETDQPYIIFEQDGGIQNSAVGLTSGATTDNNALMISNSVGSSGVEAGIVFKTGTTDGFTNATERLRILPAGGIKFNNAYTFPTSDGDADQVLQTDGSGNLSFASVSGGGGSGSNGSKPAVFMDSGNTNLDQTERTIPFDTEVLDPSSNYSLGSDGHIKITEAGFYEVSYSIPINDDSSNLSDRTRVFAFAQTSSADAFSSTTDIAQSRAQVYTREASGGSGLSTTFIYEHTANHFIRIRIDQQNNTNLSTETNQSQISIRKLSSSSSGSDTFVIVGEESDNHISSSNNAGNANGFSFSYGNGAQNTTKTSSGTDFGVVVPVACTLSRIDITFGNQGSETNSSNQTLTVFKNRSASTTTMTYNASGTGGNAFVKSFSSLSGDGVTYAAGDTFNLRATGLSGFTDTQVGPARMTAYFTVT